LRWSRAANCFISHEQVEHLVRGTGPLVDIKSERGRDQVRRPDDFINSRMSAPGSSYFVTARQKATARAGAHQEIYARNTAWIQRDRVHNG
jgi:hypothetical protein